MKEITRTTINVERRDFGDMLIICMRYALGSHTYSIYESVEWIKNNLRFCDERVTIVIIRDLMYFLKDREAMLYHDTESELKHWSDFKEFMINHAKKKKYDLTTLMH